MKSTTLASTALLLAGFGLAGDLPITFHFWDAEGEFDKVVHPYYRQNTNGQCISHEQRNDRSATKLEWFTKDKEVLPADSYCVYLFYDDGGCGGDVDHMFQVPPEGQSIGYDTVTLEQTTKATVIRAGPCPPETPKRVPRPSDEDMKEHNARLEAAKLVAGAIQDSS